MASYENVTTPFISHVESFTNARSLPPVISFAGRQEKIHKSTIVRFSALISSTIKKIVTTSSINFARVFEMVSMIDKAFRLKWKRQHRLMNH